MRKLVGLLALLGVVGVCGLVRPNIDCWQCQSAQSEAKGNLRRLYVVQEVHRAEHDRYAPLAELDFHPVRAEGRDALRYDYFVVEHSDTQFRARAVAVRDANPSATRWIHDLVFGGCSEVEFDVIKGDTWEIDGSGTTTNTEPRCE